MAETGDPAARGWGDRTGEDMSGNGVRARSGVAGGLLDELHAGGEPEFGADMGEVSLDGAW
jgi:hypothetical protein